MVRFVSATSLSSSQCPCEIGSCREPWNQTCILGWPSSCVKFSFKTYRLHGIPKQTKYVFLCYVKAQATSSLRLSWNCFLVHTPTGFSNTEKGNPGCRGTAFTDVFTTKNIQCREMTIKSARMHCYLGSHSLSVQTQVSDFAPFYQTRFSSVSLPIPLWRFPFVEFQKQQNPVWGKKLSYSYINTAHFAYWITWKTSFPFHFTCSASKKVVIIW